MQKQPAASSVALGIQDGIKAVTISYVSCDWTSDLLWEWKPSGVFLTTHIFLFLWKQKYQMWHGNQVPIRMATFLPKFVMKYLLISVENYFILSCKLQSFQVILLPQTGWDWAGKGCWSNQPWHKARENSSESKKGHYVKASVSRVTSWGWWAGSKAHKHLQTFPSERWDLVEHRGAVRRQSCPYASVAVRLLCAFREMVTSKSEAATHGSSILALFGVFFPSGVVYNKQILLGPVELICL